MMQRSYVARVGTLLVAALGLASLCSVAAAAGPGLARIEAKEAVVYLDADAGSAVLAKLTLGTLVEVQESDGEWSLVVFESDGSKKLGYVKASKVHAMGGKGKPRQARRAVEPVEERRSRPSRVPSDVLAEEGLYYIDESGPIRVEPQSPYQTRTGSTLVSALTLGIKPARLNAMLQGLSADLQISGTPSFYLHLGEDETVGEYYLVRFTVKQNRGRREIEIGSKSFYKAQAGFPQKDLFPLEAERVQKGLYVISPEVALPGGEYGILLVPRGTAEAQTQLTPRRIYDFGIR